MKRFSAVVSVLILSAAVVLSGARPVSAFSGELGNWTTGVYSLPGARQAAATTAANGYVYVMGGFSGSTMQKTVFYAKLNADGSTGRWLNNAYPLPAARYGAATVVANGYIYVIGGSASNYVATVYYAKLNANGSTGVWKTSTKPLPTAGGAARAVVVGDKLYIVGGYNGSKVFDTVLSATLNLDGSTSAWTTDANRLPAPRMGSGLDAANGYLYLSGGFDPTLSLTDSVFYAKLNADGSTGAWMTTSATLPAVRGAHTSAVLNGHLYVIGGDGASATTTASIFYAQLDPVAGTVANWVTNGIALPAPRTDAGTGNTAIANGFIYVIGGFDITSGPGYASTVFYTSFIQH